MIQLEFSAPEHEFDSFGNDNWNIDNNNDLFSAVHRYINATKRFCNFLTLCLKIILKHVLI